MAYNITISVTVSAMPFILSGVFWFGVFRSFRRTKEFFSFLSVEGTMGQKVWVLHIPDEKGPGMKSFSAVFVFICYLCSYHSFVASPKFPGNGQHNDTDFRQPTTGLWKGAQPTVDRYSNKMKVERWFVSKDSRKPCLSIKDNTINTTENHRSCIPFHGPVTGQSPVEKLVHLWNDLQTESEAEIDENTSNRDLK